MPAAAPRQRRAFSTLGGPVELGGEAEAARTLGRLVRGRTVAGARADARVSQLRGPHAPVDRARRDRRRSAPPGDAVVDPFCGSGTVLVEAMGLGRRAFGVDASPLGVAIARVRTTLLGEAGRERLVAEAAADRRGVGRAGAQAPASRGARLGPRRRSRAFTRTSLFELLGLRELVMALPEDEVGRALRLCLSSMLVKFMKAGPTAPRDGAEKRIARGIPSRMLADRAVGAGARPGGAGAAHARRDAGAGDLGGGRARAADARTAARRWCCRRPPTPGPTTTPPSTTPGSSGWGCREKKFRRVQLGARSEHVGDVSGDRLARGAGPLHGGGRPRAAARRARAAGRGRRCRRRPRRERARRHRGGGRGGRPRAGGARVAGAPAARPPAGGDLRGSAAPRAPAAAAEDGG